MSAAEARRRLAAIGRDLIMQDGDPGARRGAELLRRLGGGSPRALALADLADLPDWLRLPRAAQERLAQRAALASLSAALARSIDGAWLGGHAAVAGEAAVEWALDADPQVAQARALPPIEADMLVARGNALFRATLPPHLRGLMAGPVNDPVEVPDATARACVAAALEDAA